MEQSIFNCKINYKSRLLHLISLCEIAEYEQPHGRIWNRIGVKKRGTGEKIVVAIWACFLFNHYFQIWVCFFFFFFFCLDGFCWHVNDTANCLGCLLSQAGLVLPLFDVPVQKLHSFICSHLGHSTSSRWFFVPQVLKWLLLFNKTKLNSDEKVNVL